MSYTPTSRALGPALSSTESSARHRAGADAPEDLGRRRCVGPSPLARPPRLLQRSRAKRPLRYAATGSAVPGAKDVTLETLYDLARDDDVVLVPVELARSAEELAWCLDVDLGERAVIIGQRPRSSRGPDGGVDKPVMPPSAFPPPNSPLTACSTSPASPAWPACSTIRWSVITPVERRCPSHTGSPSQSPVLVVAPCGQHP